MTNPLKQKKTRIAVNILFIHIVPLKDKFNIYSSNSFRMNEAYLSQKNENQEIPVGMDMLQMQGETLA